MSKLMHISRYGSKLPTQVFSRNDLTRARVALGRIRNVKGGAIAIGVVRSRLGATGDCVLARRVAEVRGGPGFDNSHGYFESRGCQCAQGIGATGMACARSVAI